MKKLLLLCLVSAAASAVLAQPAETEPTASMKAYRDYRLKATEPSYSLRKIKTMVNKIKPDKDDDRHMPDAQYNSLSTQEKFTFCMIHGEDMSQNCNGMPWVVDESKKIFAYIPGIFDDEAAWSERQKKFLHNNRSQVISMLRSTIREHHRVGINLKSAILELNAVELVPDMVKIYQGNHKDQDILSVFMLLMKEGKYQPFMGSVSYHKLYGDESNYQAFIMANPGNQKLTIDRVMGFYHSKMG